MNDEAESSRAPRPYAASPTEDTVPVVVADDDNDVVRNELMAKERRTDAKKKRIIFLEHLLRELDTVVILELITLYYLDCSFFWFICRTLIHVTLLTPLPDLALARQHDEHKPFLPLLLFSFAVNFILHLLYPAPSAGEDTRGYLHGGLMIDFIGQEGPTSKWKLVALDTGILALQLVMLSVYVKRRDSKKKLAKIQGGESTTRNGETQASEGGGAQTQEAAHADREQDADAEERGVLRRTDTLSDIGADLDEEEALLPSNSETGHVDALDVLVSGQCVIGDFHLIDTLLQEHDSYQTYRQTRPETSGGTSLSPSALRQLHGIRVRFGVGGG